MQDKTDRVALSRKRIHPQPPKLVPDDIIHHFYSIFARMELLSVPFVILVAIAVALAAALRRRPLLQPQRHGFANSSPYLSLNPSSFFLCGTRFVVPSAPCCALFRPRACYSVVSNTLTSSVFSLSLPLSVPRSAWSLVQFTPAATTTTTATTLHCLGLLK